MNITTTEKELESFDPWYKNYAVGIPEFAYEFKTRLLAFEDNKNPYRDHIALAVAVCNRSVELLHDISQDFFDRNEEKERDETMAEIARAIASLTINKNIVPNELKQRTIWHACALAMNKLDSHDTEYDNVDYSASVLLSRDAFLAAKKVIEDTTKEIEEIVAVTTVITKLI